MTSSLGPQPPRYYREGGLLVRLVDGGTGANSALQARKNLGVPGTADAETITGIWTFTNTVTVDSAGDVAGLLIKYNSSDVSKAFDIQDETAASQLWFDAAGGFHYFSSFIHSGSFSVNLVTAALTANRTLTVPDITGTVVVTAGTQTVTGVKTFSGACVFSGATGLRVAAAAGVRFEDSSDTSKKLFLDLSALGTSTSRPRKYQNFAAAETPLGNIASPASGELGKVDATGKTTALAATNLANAPATGKEYLCLVYGAVEAAGVGTVTVTLRWTDVFGAQSAAAVINMATGAPGYLAVPVEVASGSVTVEATAPTSGTYRVRARVLALD